MGPGFPFKFSEFDSVACHFETRVKSGSWSLLAAASSDSQQGPVGWGYSPAPLSQGVVRADPPKEVKVGQALTEVTKSKR